MTAASKIAAGLCDDVVSLTAAAVGPRKPVLLAPAMNADMWAKPAVQRNLAQLRADGLHVVDPREGWLSCRQKGVGRMAEPEEIKSAIVALLPKGE